MNIKGKITISRRSDDSDDTVGISFHDEKAVITFAEATLSLEDFARALTGIARTDCVIRINGVENVGKVREIKDFSASLPGPSYKLKRGEIRGIAEEACPKEWEVFDSFNRRGMFFVKDGIHYVRFTITRWV